MEDGAVVRLPLLLGDRRRELFPLRAAQPDVEVEIDRLHHLPLVVSGEPRLAERGRRLVANLVVDVDRRPRRGDGERPWCKLRRASRAKTEAARRPPRLTRYSAGAICGRRDAVICPIDNSLLALAYSPRSASNASGPSSPCQNLPRVSPCVNVPSARTTRSIRCAFARPARSTSRRSPPRSDTSSRSRFRRSNADSPLSPRQIAGRGAG
jgi:hypothetical protein